MKECAIPEPGSTMATTCMLMSGHPIVSAKREQLVGVCRNETGCDKAERQIGRQKCVCVPWGQTAVLLIDDLRWRAWKTGFDFNTSALFFYLCVTVNSSVCM